MIRVLLVDDERLVCDYLGSILRQAADLDVVAAAHDGAGAVEAAIRHRPDVILMDVRMPGVNGLTAIKRIRTLSLPIRIVALATFVDDAMVLRAMQAGADGFVVKSTAPSELVNVVRVAAQGQTVLSPDAARCLIAASRDGDAVVMARQQIASLTRREQQVVELLAAGDSNAAIGRALQLSEPTIKGHVSRILIKLQCTNRTQAGIRAVAALRANPSFNESGR